MANKSSTKGWCYGSGSSKVAHAIRKYYNADSGWKLVWAVTPPGVGDGVALVDDALVAKIQSVILSVKTPQRITLLTGDGNDNGGYGVCFHDVVLTALHLGWHVDIWCWKSCCSNNYKLLASDKTPRFSLNFFDSHRDAVTFTKAKPNVKGVDDISTGLGQKSVGKGNWKAATKGAGKAKAKGVGKSSNLRADLLNPNNPKYDPIYAARAAAAKAGGKRKGKSFSIGKVSNLDVDLVSHPDHLVKGMQVGFSVWDVLFGGDDASSVFAW